MFYFPLLRITRLDKLAMKKYALNQLTAVILIQFNFILFIFYLYVVVRSERMLLRIIQ